MYIYIYVYVYIHTIYTNVYVGVPHDMKPSYPFAALRPRNAHGKPQASRPLLRLRALLAFFAAAFDG